MSDAAARRREARARGVVTEDVARGIRVSWWLLPLGPVLAVGLALLGTFPEATGMLLAIIAGPLYRRAAGTVPRRGLPRLLGMLVAATVLAGLVDAAILYREYPFITVVIMYAGFLLLGVVISATAFADNMRRP